MRRDAGPDRRPTGFRDEAPRWEPVRGSRVREAEIGERWPDIPEWVDVADLDDDVRRDLRSLSKENSAFVGAHLIAAGTLADEDPEPAWAHARAARSKGGRIAVVRETAGLVAYRAGEWSEAISELRAARRLGGGAGHLAVLADCERALGHPEKAIEIARSAEAATLEDEEKTELTIVVAGARADLGQLDAALVSLEATGLLTAEPRPDSARIYFAYADLLEQAGRRAEALDWFMKAADADPDEETEAGERLTALAEAGIEPVDLADSAKASDAPPIDSAESDDRSDHVQAVQVGSHDQPDAVGPDFPADADAAASGSESASGAGSALSDPDENAAPVAFDSGAEELDADETLESAPLDEHLASESMDEPAPGLDTSSGTAVADGEADPIAMIADVDDPASRADGEGEPAAVEPVDQVEPSISDGGVPDAGESPDRDGARNELPDTRTADSGSSDQEYPDQESAEDESPVDRGTPVAAAPAADDESMSHAQNISDPTDRQATDITSGGSNHSGTDPISFTDQPSLVGEPTAPPAKSPDQAEDRDGSNPTAGAVDPIAPMFSDLPDGRG